MATYSERSTILKGLGYEDYPFYLKSPLWYTIKQRVFAEKGLKCVLCGHSAKVVHHLYYSPENLSGESVDGLEPLCNRCHSRVELDRFGQKRSLQEAQITYTRLLGEAKRRHRKDF